MDTLELKDRIALARKQAGLSQEQLGERLGVSRQAVSKWESGQANPDVDYLARMCDVLEVSSDWLLLGREPEAAPTPAPCPGCGQRLEPGARFCPHCGRALAGASAPATYTLMLTDHGEFAYQTYLAVSRLSQMDYAQKDAAWNCPLSQEEVGPIVNSVPVILCRGLSQSEVSHALSLFSNTPAPPLVYRDSDGDTVEQLQNALPVPSVNFRDAGQKGGMSFGMTVLAVIVGIIAAVLLLAIL